MLQNWKEPVVDHLYWKHLADAKLACAHLVKLFVVVAKKKNSEKSFSFKRKGKKHQSQEQVNKKKETEKRGGLQGTDDVTAD